MLFAFITLYHSKFNHKLGGDYHRCGWPSMWMALRYLRGIKKECPCSFPLFILL